jgi:hypothetical protein
VLGRSPFQGERPPAIRTDLRERLSPPAAQPDTFVDVELLVCDEPPLEAFAEVELCVPALLDPSWPVLAVDPVEVVVPAVPPEPAPVCADPLAEVEVEAVPVPLEVGGTVPDGLCELDWLLPFPVEVWPELESPAPVLAVPAPDPWAAVDPVFDGVVAVLEPVCVVAVPVDGVDPVEELPAWAVDELPVDADADEPPDPDELAAVELFVVVVALAEPPLVVVGLGVGEGEGVGVGVGEGVGVGVEVGVCDADAGPVHQLVCEPVVPPLE